MYYVLVVLVLVLHILLYQLGTRCRTQNLINKKNSSRQSNNKFRDRPHMIRAEFENGIEDENNFQIQEIDFQNGADG